MMSQPKREGKGRTYTVELNHELKLGLIRSDQVWITGSGMKVKQAKMR